mmetsp:Transcript_23556/g.35342  ORF Transcript_23556/g.35342 Transcript_23556/m.35342 type:complete len:99 (+) Transcript_23556:667-963(+)
MFCQVERVTSVHAGHPNKASPANIESGAVMLDIHGTHVAHLPVEEFKDVDQLQSHINKHAELKNTVVNLHVLVCKANSSHSPEHHSKAAVSKHFQVPS